MVYDMRPAPAVCPTILRCRVEAQGADHLLEEACVGTVGVPYGGGVTNRHGARPQLWQRDCVSCDSKTPAVPYRGIAVWGWEIKKLR